MKTDFFKKDFGNNVYAVSCSNWTLSNEEGGAILESWVIVGSEKTLAIDSGIPGVEGFKDYLESEFGLPVIMFNSHGHDDHIGCNDQFDEVWLNRNDWPLLLRDWTGNMRYSSYEDLPYRLHNINDKDVINIGKRNLLAIEIKGHTKGSIMLYDATTNSLFSGDSVARRILYGLLDWTPLSQYIGELEKLSYLKINHVYSMHDPFALPGNMYQRIINGIIENIETTKEIWEIPGEKRKFLRIFLGKNEADPEFFDFVMPLERKEEVILDLKEHSYL